MSDIVFKDKDKEIKKVFKIFINQNGTLKEPMEEINDYGNVYETNMFSSFESEESALKELFENDKLSPWQYLEMVILPVYELRPSY